MQDSGLTEIIPFIWLSAIWGQSYMGVVDGCQMAGILLLGLRNSHLKGQNPWWLWHTCLLIQQEIVHFTYTVSVSLSIPKKGNVKECSNYRTIVLISHASKVMLKIVQARLQQYMNCELPDVQAGKDWKWEEKGTTEEEMVGWHHQLNGHEFE